MKIYYADQDYAEALIAMFESARQRILVEAMAFDDRGQMRTVIAALMNASRRGVEVTVIFDKYTYASILRTHGPSALKKFRRSLHQMTRDGISLHESGLWRLNPFAGRCHAKAVIVDDLVLMAGGINACEDSFHSKDFMFRYDDPSLAATLWQALPVAAAERGPDRVLFTGADYRVLLDGGTSRHSLIYDETCDMAERATAIWYVSKLSPDDRLLEVLSRKQTRYWFNTRHSAVGSDKMALGIDRLKYRLHNEYTGRQLLHAKCCIFRFADGSYAAMSGSHNFNSRGVNFGTQELAVVSWNQDVCQDLIAFAESLSG